MRSSPFTVVYDACVMYPAPLRSFLMYVSLEGCYRARWTAQIHDEWKRNLLKNRPDFTQEKLDKISSLMGQAVPDCLVTGYDALINGLTLPDQDDRHVLAAAIRCGAGVIVTMNLKDLPPAALSQYGVEAQHPDEFLFDLMDLDLAAVLNAASKHRASLKNPELTAQEYLDMLERQGLTQTCRKLAAYSLLI
ncbi:PIN domain-containing protein [Comamonas thiooxydans]|uniref:PIN domain-containing protein n=1 Tax=Comamonas thiooxydans TaxID=363952 RepID=UPI0015A7502F|nr:PIN domain-containing protein [Comamonas thiooxydans]QOQ83811.1 PIN domain-containing protein [Comamonas thiooxydans]